MQFVLMARTFYPTRVGELQRRRNDEKRERISPHTVHLEGHRYDALHSLPSRHSQAVGSDHILAALSRLQHSQEFTGNRLEQKFLEMERRLDHMHHTLGLLVDSVLNIHSKLDIPLPVESPIPSPMRSPSPCAGPSTSSPSAKPDPWEAALKQREEKEAAATAAAAKAWRDSQNGWTGTL